MRVKTIDGIVRNVPIPGAFHLENYAVINTATAEAVEGASDWSRAARSARILNDHEKRNGRPEVYTYLKIEKG